MSLFSKTNKPKHLTRYEKRTVVGTVVGWVNRLKKGNHYQDTILVPMIGGGVTGAPKIDDLWHNKKILEVNNTVNTWVSFTQPISSTAKLKLNVANTISGSAKVASANTTVYGTNKILFRWTPTVAGTYKIQAQTVANGSATAVNVRSTNTGNTSASLVVSGTVSNTGGLVLVLPAT